MILEGYLGEIVGSCYPEDTLVGKEMLANYRHTVVARRVAPQEIRYQFAGFAVEVAEGSSIRNNPQSLVFILGDEETVGGGAVHRILLVGKQPLLG